MFSEFRYPFRKYQRMILTCAEEQRDSKYHIVAPPGSGKTIVGLELIRRFGAPAVVFAPTSTIQAQWREKLGMFVAEESLDTWVSLDPVRLAPVTIFTYQLISTPGEAQEQERSIAVQNWLEDLLREGQAASEDEARQRIETLRQNNLEAYRKEIARRYLRVKRQLLYGQPEDLARFLHPNALRLIQALVDHGVKTIVLDECHHLLDYWALVLRYLIGKIDAPRVIGLTATLPSPEDDQEYDNYTSLLGEVDFEVPTPAVVKEGDLAPYRDLVYFVGPTEREQAYLEHIQAAFETVLGELTDSQRFRDWVTGIFESQRASWENFLSQTPLFSLAVIRFMTRIEQPIPDDLLLPAEAEKPLGLEDWAILLERFGLDVLKVSPDDADHHLLARLRKLLLPFGFTLTEKGMRQGRSAGDQVLAFSEAKDHAVGHILVEESQAMGERLRAVVVSDFETMTHGVQRSGRGAEGEAFPLARDAGSALRLFGFLAGRPETAALNPILVTGRTLMVSAAGSNELVAAFNAYLREHGSQARCRGREVSNDAVEIVGEGAAWSSRTYVAMVTQVFEAGLSRCLVGTRGIFGEGWDSLSLNTLIDLTSVTTSTSVQQLRGRSIRLDPNWPHKVAHNWDVVCVALHFKKGSSDLERFVQRHNRYWGIVPLSYSFQVLQDAVAAIDSLVSQAMLPAGGTTLASPDPSGATDPLGAEQRAQIVKGIAHVSPQLAFDLCVRGFKRAHYAAHTAHMLKEIPRREQSYRLWGIGDSYSNFSYSATRLDVRDLNIRTAFTVQNTLKRMLRMFRASILGGLLVTGLYAAQAIQVGLQADNLKGLELAAIIAAAGTALTFLLNLRQAYRLGRALLIEQPPDAILLDIGRALLAALAEAGLISRNLQADFVRVVEQPDNSYDVMLDYASSEDAALFIQAYREIFDVVRDQRYLILRDDRRMPNLGWTVLWLPVRQAFRRHDLYRPAYHPVPKVLSTRKELAEAFARAWKKFVGGSELIYTRNEKGRMILLKARAQRRPKVKGLAFEIWR